MTLLAAAEQGLPSELTTFGATVRHAGPPLIPLSAMSHLLVLSAIFDLV